MSRLRLQLARLLPAAAVNSPGPGVDLLVAAPLATEGKAIAAVVLSGVRRGRCAGRVFWTGRLGSRRLVVQVVGTGAAASGATTRAALAAFRPAALLLFGTCGAIEEHLSIGDLVVADRVAPWSDGACGAELTCDAALVAALVAAGLERGLAASADVVVAGGSERAERAGAGVAVVDWESAAVVAAAHEAGVPVAVVRAVTDRAGDDARQEFLRALRPVLRSAASRLAALVEPALRRREETV